MNVRLIGESDYPCFKKMFCDYYAELDCEDDPLHLFCEYVLPDLKAKLFDVALAVTENGEAVGFIIYQIDDVINDWNFKEGCGDIRELYVATDYRKKGAGRAMLGFAERELKKYGATEIYTLPTEESETFFIKCGYCDAGEYCPDADNKVFAKDKF